MNASRSNRVVLVFALALSIAANAAEVTETEVIHHGQPIPRFTKQYIHVLEVPPGQTVKLPAVADYDAIEVGGTLDASQCERLRTIHLLILPGGKLVPPPAKCDWSFKDVPIDRTIDPDQWGNGIVNFGDFLPAGTPKTPYAFAMPVKAGSTTLELAAVPDDWEAGDELLLPDTRQVSKRQRIRRESPVFIAAIDGSKVTLSKPLDFEHDEIRDLDGNLVAHLPVFNLTRNFVIRSENPSGTRGHIVHLEDARAIADCIKLVDLGRTTIKPLGPENQVGRYAWHWHHNVPGVHTGSAHAGTGPIDDPSDPGHPTVGSLTNSVLVNSVDGPKWGAVIHATHFTHVARNIAVGFNGSCFVTEDGDEIGNVIEENAALYCKGNGLDGKFSFLREMPGGEGAGFWGHGTGRNVWRNNMAYNCAIGFAPFYREQVRTRRVPSKPGGPLDTGYDPRTALPIEFKGNVAVSNDIGVEYWNQPKFPVVDQIAANNRIQIKPGNGEPGHVYLVNPTLIGGEHGIVASAAYTSSITVEGGEIVGAAQGVGDARIVRLSNVTMQNKVNIRYVIRPRETLLDSIVHRPLGNHPKRYFEVTDLVDWYHGDQLPRRIADWQPADGQRYVLKNHQREGKDYLLFEPYSLRSKPAFAGPSRYGTGYSPEPGLTAGEVWDKYGFAYGGGVVAESEAVELEGFNVIAKPGLDYPLGPPRAVVVEPSPHAEAKIKPDSRIRFRIYLTGEDQFSARPVPVQVDGGRPIYMKPSQGLKQNQRLGDLAVPITPGRHTVKTWREDARGRTLPGSELTFSYFVADRRQDTPSPPKSNSPQPNPLVGVRAVEAR